MTKAEWNHTVNPEQSLIFCLCTDDNACLRITFSVKESRQQLIGFISLERRCPFSCRPALIRYCHLANYELTMGFFAVDEKDGELKFRHSADVEGIVVTAKFMDNFIKTLLNSMRKRYLAIQKIMCGYSLEAVTADR